MTTKLIKTLVVAGLLCLGATAVPAVAQMQHGGGMGRMGGGMADLTPEKQQAVTDIQAEYQAKIFPLRQDLYSKRAELNAVMAQATPDLAKAKALNKDINALETQLGDLMLEARAKIAKETGLRGGGIGGGGGAGGGCGGGMMGGGAGGGCGMMGGGMMGGAGAHRMGGGAPAGGQAM